MYGSAPLNIFLLVLVAIIFVIIFIKRQNMSIGEGFEAPGRTDCAIYYTPNTETCDSAPFDLPDGTPCKLNFRGWGKYPSTTPTGKQPPPNLNTTDPGLANKGDPQNWAWCFKTDATPQRLIDDIGNRGAVEADALVSDLGDGASYARLKIKDLSYAALKPIYCNDTIVDRPNYQPPTDAMIGFGGTPAFGVYLTSTVDGILYNANADAANILRKLYKLAVNGTKLQLVPKEITANYYILRIDPCSRPNVLKSESKPFNFGTIGGGTLDLITAANVEDDLYGDIATLNDRIQRFSNEIESLKLRANNILAGNGTKVEYAPGLIRKIYNANFNFTSVARTRHGWGPTYPNIVDTQTMERAYNEVIQKSGTPTSVVVTTTPYFNRYDPIGRLFYVFEGFLYITIAGYYQFSINSDDAGDLMINNQLVAAHYDYHGPDNNGTRMKSFYLAKGYHKLVARVHEGFGGETMFLKWRPPSAKDYVNIPESTLYHNAFYNLQKDGIASNLQGKATTLESRITRISNAINSINTKANAFYISLLKSLTPNTAAFKSYISNDNRVYIGIGDVPADSSLQTSVNRSPSVVPVRQLMVSDVTEVSTYSSRAPPQIDFNKLPTYTIAFWIRIERKHNVWRNILLIGENDWPDRNPGIYIWPESTRIHFRHNSTRNLNDGLDLDISPPIGEWFHYAAVMTPKTITLYVNGSLAQTPLNLPPGHNFTWGSHNKKLHLGLDRLQIYAQSRPQYINGSVMIQKMYYVSAALTADDIADLASETINNSLGMTNTVNAPSKLERFTNANANANANANDNDNGGLFDRVTISEIYPYQVGGKVFNVYVKVIGDEKWLLVLNYRRRGDTNPPLAPQEWATGTFPLFESDELTDKKNEYGSKSWGHLTPDFLSRLNATEMRFYAKSSNARKSVIHFKTSDPNVIRYATTGKGHFGNFEFVELAGHTSSIPGNMKSPHCGGQNCQHANQDNNALTTFPFWRWGEAHWAMFPDHHRWEVDDFVANDGYNNNTYHSVWVRINKPLDTKIKRLNYTYGQERFANMKETFVNFALNGTTRAHELGPWNMHPWYNLDHVDKVAKWIWNRPNAQSWAPANEMVVFQDIIQNNTNVPIAATLYIIVDDWGTVRFNKGTPVTTNGGWHSRNSGHKVLLDILPGNNLLEMECINGGGPAGFIYSVIENSTSNVMTRSSSKTVWLLPEKNTYGNNGTTTCNAYCRGVGGGSWNGELPHAWNGAKCIASNKSPGPDGCLKTIGYQGGLVCTCQQTGRGWDSRGWRDGQNAADYQR